MKDRSRTVWTIAIALCVVALTIGVAIVCVYGAGRMATPQVEQEDCDAGDIRKRDVADCGNIFGPTAKPTAVKPKPVTTTRKKTS